MKWLKYAVELHALFAHLGIIEDSIQPGFLFPVATLT